ncbi:MAG: hypothetical protein JWL87_238 [Candidatus Adlerbacteria bacterium]|nr:hypothetical protein [Candidatus Adlerbacteria bacterium]
MLRLIILATLFGCVSAASAQEVLVQSPPQYAGSEFYKEGRLKTLDGQIKKLRQWVEKKDGQTFVVMDVLGENDKVFIRSVLNADTLLGRAKQMITREVITIRGGDCSVATLYPIVLNKHYGCTAQMEVRMETEAEGDQFEGKRSLVYNRLKHDAEGKRTHLCARVKESYPDLEGEAEICYTPDGKWISEMNILSAVER